MRKIFAIAVSAGILLSQAAEVCSPSDGWYWPFMDYPMYSRASHAGEIYYHYGFQVLPCEGAGAPKAVGFELLGVKFYDYQTLLSRAAAVNERWAIDPESSRQAVETLTELARSRAGAEYCDGEVLVQRHRIDPELGYRVPDWQPVRRWSLSGGGLLAGGGEAGP